MSIGAIFLIIVAVFFAQLVFGAIWGMLGLPVAKDDPFMIKDPVPSDDE